MNDIVTRLEAAIEETDDWSMRELLRDAAEQFRNLSILTGAIRTALGDEIVRLAYFKEQAEARNEAM